MTKKLLLDTHTVLWWVQEPKKLPQSIELEIKSPLNHVFVSVAALWEMVIKKSLGKLDFPGDILEALKEDNIEILPINISHVFRVGELSPHHRDPFDRIQIAQAIEENMVFITRDPMVKLYNINSMCI